MPIRSVRPLSRAQLESLHTKQLLAHLQRLRACQQNFAASDYQPGDTDYDDTTLIFFKDDPRWRSQLDDVKQILGTREHIPRRAERKSKRIARAAHSKPRSRPKRR
jgi:hypothetical protein